MPIDACHSGEVDKEELEKMKKNSTSNDGIVAIGGKGAIPIFTSDSKKMV